MDNPHAYTCMYGHAWGRLEQEGGGGGGCASPSSSSFFSCKPVHLTRAHEQGGEYVREGESLQKHWL
jgi:hypothetical protein